MLAMTSNFHPASEPKNGYIGKASITIANGVRLNNISVFEKDGKRTIDFGSYKSKDEERSYVQPSSKEAYAAMVDVVSAAVDNKDHFAIAQGDYSMKFEVRGALVEEPYADGRFSVSVGDLCTLNSITTRVVPFQKDGKDAQFTSVEMPRVYDADGKISMYTDKDGKEQANLQFEPLVNTWTEDGKEKKHDYVRDLRIAVLSKRKELAQPSLEDQVNAAAAQKTESEKAVDAPTRDEPVR